MESLISERLLVDKTLVDNAKAGDKYALEQLFANTYDEVFSYLHSRTGGNHELAQDITQETFLNAYSAFGNYEMTESPFIAWLIIIAKNALISYYRKQQRSPKVFDDDLSEITWKVPDGATPFDERVIGALTVDTSLSFINPAFARVMKDRSEGLTMQDISEAKGVPRNTVGTQNRRALKQLKKLEEDGAINLRGNA